MINDEEIINSTKELFYKRFYNYFINKKFDKTKHLILDRLFPEQRKITSIGSGMQTSLGSFFEKLATIFSGKNGFEIISNDQLQRPNLNEEIRFLLDETKQNRESGNGEIKLNDFKEKLNKLLPSPLASNQFNKKISGKGCDLILKKEQDVFIFDLKTPQINSGYGNTANGSIIEWTAYWKSKFDIDANNIFAKFIFPYNPFDENNDESWWDHVGDRAKPLTREDVQVGNEFWSFLTDNDNALKSIKKAFNHIAQNRKYISLYSESFKIDSKDKEKIFKEKVRIFRIRQLKNIEYHPENGELNLTKKQKWIHLNCVFEEKFNKLLNEKNYKCPICGKYLKQSSL